MPSHTSFYPACPLDDLAAAPPLLLSKGFNPGFLNLALLDKGSGRDMLLPYQPFIHPEE
jgi:hypothetical protein